MIIVPFSEVMNDFANYHSKAMKWCIYTNKKILSTVGQDDSVLCDPDCRQKRKTFSKSFTSHFEFQYYGLPLPVAAENLKILLFALFALEKNFELHLGASSVIP